MMRGDVFLSKNEEAAKGIILDRVVKGGMTAEEKAVRLGMSKRRVFRLKTKFRESGMSAPAHGNRNRKPLNSLSEETRTLVIGKGTGERKGASLSHMAELFVQKNRLSVEDSPRENFRPKVFCSIMTQTLRTTETGGFLHENR